MNFDYKELCGKESLGGCDSFGIKISVAASPKLPNLKSDAIRDAAYRAMDLIENAMMQAVIAEDPKSKEEAKVERETILGLFPQPIYVEEIPHGYAPGWHNAHLPWFIVTTTVGRVKIGWRRSVINIDWSETKGTKTSGELFFKEDVTKDSHSIHAWGYEKARAYINAILTGVPL